MNLAAAATKNYGNMTGRCTWAGQHAGSMISCKCLKKTKENPDDNKIEMIMFLKMRWIDTVHRKIEEYIRKCIDQIIHIVVVTV